MSPFDPLWADWLHYLGRAYYHVGDYPAAVATARRLLQSHPDFRSAYLTLIAGFGELGQPEEAQRAMAGGRRRFGDDFFTRLARRPPEVRIEDHEHLLASLRKAGALDRTAR